MHPTTKSVPVASILSVRVDESNLDHHLWCNHGVWWIHYVVHEGNHKRRVRHSLRIRDVDVARRLRDEELRRLWSLQEHADSASGSESRHPLEACA